MKPKSLADLGMQIGEDMARDLLANPPADPRWPWPGIDRRGRERAVAAGIIPGTEDWKDLDQVAQVVCLVTFYGLDWAQFFPPDRN